MSSRAINDFANITKKNGKRICQEGKLRETLFAWLAWSSAMLSLLRAWQRARCHAQSVYIFSGVIRNRNCLSVAFTRYGGSGNARWLQLSTPPTPACSPSMNRLVKRDFFRSAAWRWCFSSPSSSSSMP